MANTLWQPGTVLEGRYELLQLVGEGGMGVVWRVFDREWDRDLALKLPRQIVLENPVLRERYVREAETWIGLGVHPHIVQCWFVTEIFGVPALFLDYLTGGSLASWMEDGHVGPGHWQLNLEIAMQVAEGLAYAHSKGVVHRDVKPENLLIRGDERVCVTDFGLVKTAVAETDVLPAGTVEGPAGMTLAAGVTCAGAFLGTPRYAAPEQWGAAEKVGPAADIYALGVILFEMCAGRRPFDEDHEDTPPMDIIRRHLATPAPDPRTFNPEIPVELAHLCLLMLEKEPGRRPPDMGALRESLHDIYAKLTGRTFRAAAPLMGAQSPDVLNNQAVSLHSLGKTAEAVETLRRGLGLDPGHPECLYNLLQLEKRSGTIGHLEALRRIKQARAYYPLALLLIEHCMPEEALEALQEVDPDHLSSPGLHHRARGDALMYLGEYAEAERSYGQAQQHMPRDTIAEARRNLARTERGSEPGGAIYFPSSQPIHVEANLDSRVLVLLDGRGEGVITLTQEAASYRRFKSDLLEVRVSRCPDAGRVSQAWLSGDRLAIADSRGFEFRDYPSMRLVSRGEGELLACSPRVDYMVTHTTAGPGLYVMKRNLLQPIATEDHPSHGPVLAAFDRGGQSLALLLPSGRLATLDRDGNAIPEPWPTRVESHQQAKCMALFDQDTILIGLANGNIRCYDLSEEEIEFETELDEVPRSLEVCGANTLVIVRTANGNFFLLDRSGRVLLCGDGPLAVAPDDQSVLVVSEGRQVLYNLDPFYELRRWPDARVKGAKSVAFSDDGRLALVLGVPGSYAVWEIDESRRAYQRELLMSPGRSYSDILTAHAQFDRHLTLAHEARARGDSLESYRHLQRARRVPGYGHGERALDFAWSLLATLRRDQLEAVWERLSIAGSLPIGIDLHPEGHKLLFSFSHQATLALDQEGAAHALWTVSRPHPIRLLKFVRSYVLIADESGHVALHEPDDGTVLHEYSLERGSLSRLILHDSAVIHLGRDGSLGQFNLSGGEHHVRSFDPSYIRLIAPWQGAKVLATTEDSFGIFDLSQPNSEMEPLRLGLAISKVPCFLEHVPDRGLLILSFSSGTLRILDASGAGLGVLCTLPHGEGIIVTDFQLMPELGVATTATAGGVITFWDLRTEQRLDQFVAHRSGISSLKIGRGGRDLLTCGEDGILRYWETSWSAGAVRDNNSEISWLTKSKPVDRLSRLIRGFSSTH